MDVVYAKGARRFCQSCGAKGPRVAVSTETLYADQVALSTSAWNEWVDGETMKKLTLPEGGYADDTRFTG